MGPINNSQLTLHTDSRTSDSGALWWEGKKILGAVLKYCVKNTGNRSE
jgi:hypothetical protein